jgi:hypothetical protein
VKRPLPFLGRDLVVARLLRRLWLPLGLAACASARLSPPIGSSASFVLEDAVRFAEVFARLSSVTDSAAFLDTAYIARGTPGLRAYQARYPLSGTGLVNAIRRFPQDYASVGQRVDWLATQEDTLRRVLEHYARVVPGAVMLPVYFVVGEHFGVNSGSEVGPLLSIENGAAQIEKTALPEFIAHEMTHIQQFSAVGLARYRELYISRPWLLGVVVREGIAEFVAELVTGRVTQPRAKEYFDRNKRQLWTEFQGLLCSTENGDWVGARTRDPSRPRSLGYAIGAEIARMYYQAAPNKSEALKTLVSSDDYAAIFLASGFSEKYGVSREWTGAVLAACGL